MLQTKKIRLCMYQNPGTVISCPDRWHTAGCLHNYNQVPHFHRYLLIHVKVRYYKTLSCVGFLETESLSVALAALELTMQNKLASNSQTLPPGC